MAERKALFFARRRLRIIRHGVDSGIPISLLALSLIFRVLRWKASPTRSTLFSEGPNRSWSFAIYRHLSCCGFHTTVWRCSSRAGLFLSWSDIFTAQPQSTEFLRTQAPQKLLCSRHRHFYSTCSPSGQWRNKRPPHKQTWRDSLTICE
jgi:hypothetical protein